MFRLVQWHDTENERWFDFITNNSLLTGPQVAELYRNRWKVELFFKKTQAEPECEALHRPHGECRYESGLGRNDCNATR